MFDFSRLHAFLNDAAARGRTVVSVPPFRLYFHPTDSLKYLNYAVPAEGAEPGPDAIAGLRDAFHASDRLPRLEWIEEIAPRVAPALAAAGMTEELRTPLMACTPEQLVVAQTDVDGLVVRVVEDGDLRECGDLQRIAFGQEPLDADEQPSDPRTFGGGAVLARAGGEPVAAAQWTGIVDGVTEIVGVATAEPWRGRGLAGVVTAAASRAAFDAGASLCILSPGGEIAQRVYARAGFRRVATMLHWSDGG